MENPPPKQPNDASIALEALRLSAILEDHGIEIKPKPHQSAAAALAHLYAVGLREIPLAEQQEKGDDTKDE